MWSQNLVELLWWKPDIKLYSRWKFPKHTQLQKKLIHCKSTVAEELRFTGVSMVLHIHWNKCSNSPVCDDKKRRSETVQSTQKASGKLQISAFFPSRFWKKAPHYKQSWLFQLFTVAAVVKSWRACVCLPERVCTESGEEVVTSSQSWRRSEQ